MSLPREVAFNRIVLLSSHLYSRWLWNSFCRPDSKMQDVVLPVGDLFSLQIFLDLLDDNSRVLGTSIGFSMCEIFLQNWIDQRRNHLPSERSWTMRMSIVILAVAFHQAFLCQAKYLCWVDIHQLKSTVASALKKVTSQSLRVWCTGKIESRHTILIHVSCGQ